MPSKYMSVAEIRKRKCPVSRKPCIAPDCALWRGGMVQLDHMPGLGTVHTEAGICQLARKGVK